MAAEPDRGSESRPAAPAGGDPLGGLAAWTALASGAERAVVRVVEPSSGRLVALRVWARSPALAAELAGSHVPLERMDWSGQTARGDHVLRRPTLRGEVPVGSLEVARSGQPFALEDAALVELAASLLPLVLGERDEGTAGSARAVLLQLAGEALEAGSRPSATPGLVVRLAAAAAGARAALLWSANGGGLELEAAYGLSGDPGSALADCARRGLDAPGPVSIARDVEAGDGSFSVATLRLGEPARGALQLVLPAGAAPHPEELSDLAAFGVRAAHALRAAEAAVQAAEELERIRALVGVIGQAASRLSLSHTLDTATERIAELLGTDRLAVYLGRGPRLQVEAQHGVEGPHLRVAEELLELALGPYRGRDSLWIPDAGAEPRLARFRHLFREAEIGAALAVPLAGQEQLVGLLAVYPREGETISEEQVALVSSLAPQLAVAVDNARLHEDLVVAGQERERALESERRAADRVEALYEVSRSFADSLSLEATLSAVTRTLVERLNVDAAAVRMLDPRGERLEMRSLHVAHERMEESVRTILSVPQPVGMAPIRRVMEAREPLRLDPASASELPGYAALVPFLEKGSTAVVLPVATSVEVVATTTLVSFDPERPVDDETVKIALAIAQQAALAIDNARLYQQQKGLADTMQRALLAHTEPRLKGFEMGAVYESSARVDVGGDIYDFAELPDGRLAVVLGDVAGHGIEAAADMAMAKYVFRSLSREHPGPSDFLAAANQVVVGELGGGKFVTMLYLTIDPGSGRIQCASAGHPAPRVLEGETVRELPVHGLPLGVEDETDYEEAEIVPRAGSVVVLHTDGVVESRREQELFGVERLDELLRENCDLPARELAREILARSRAFAGGELPDDCAVVVIRRS